MDSYVRISDHGTTFIGPDAVRLFQASTVRAALRMHLDGMKSRRMPLTRLLSLAAGFTGRPAAAPRAIADLTAWLDAMRAATPIE